MKRWIVTLVVALGLGLAAAPAQAEERAVTETTMKVLPGHGTAFHEGDPIRVCTMSTTETIVDHVVAMRWEIRDVGKKWQTVVDFKLEANKLGCIIAVMHDIHGDFQVRIRTFKSRHVMASTSRTVTLRAASADLS